LDIVMAAFFYDSPAAAMAISSDERQFFVTLGERITQLRKARSITQVQMAQALGVSQQTVHAYEAGSRRIPVSALPVVASTLAVSLEVLFGEERAKAGRGKPGPVPLWQQHIEAVAQLPKSQQQFVARMIEMALAQASTQGAAR
jgi:transcriptional regulator with XRE-family HTH domain